MSSDPSVICCGGVSAAVKERMGSLINSKWLSQPAIMSFADITQIEQSVPSSKKNIANSHSFTIEKCGHRLPSSEFCSFCNQNRELLYSSIQKSIELQDNQSSALVIADLCSSSSMWCYDQIMEILPEILPQSVVGTLFILPCQSLQGWDSYFAAYCFSLSLQASAYSIIRSLGEPLHVPTNSESSSQQARKAMDLQQCVDRIAADIIPNYFLQYSSDGRQTSSSAIQAAVGWPYSVCSYGDRIIDIRSSLLYKSTMLEKKTPSRDHMHPLKVVTSSLHRLGMYYQDFCVANGCMSRFAQKESYLISYQDLIWNRTHSQIEVGCLSSSVRSSGSSFDMMKSFRHATPGLMWMDRQHLLQSNSLSEPANRLHVPTRQGHYQINRINEESNSTVDENEDDLASFMRDSCSTTTTTAAGGKTRTQQQNNLRNSTTTTASSGKNSNRGVDGDENCESLGSLAFQSPFGEMELFRHSQCVHQLLDRGCYRHLFDENFDANTVNDCLTVIDEYLEHS